jgi:hypothetical protein
MSGEMAQPETLSHPTQLTLMFRISKASVVPNLFDGFFFEVNTHTLQGKLHN